jgi:hypothetical protein
MTSRFAGMLVACAALATLAGGCSSGESVGTVTGSITLDGAPLKSGQIRFVPLDGETATAGAVITDGQYSATVAPGQKTVEITSPQGAPPRKMYDDAPSPSRRVAETDLVPARYNVQSELKVEVRPGEERHDFELHSK